MKPMTRAACLFLLVSAFLVIATSVVMLFGDGSSRGTPESSLTLISEFQPSPPPPTARSEEIRLAFARRRERMRTHRYLSDTHLIQDALDQASATPSPPPNTTPKVAFLFLVRGEIFFEPLWRQFFEGHEDRHSIYVHAAPGYAYPNSSFFFGKQIPSKKVERFSPTLVNAVRRLFAEALLDPESHNEWFVNLCERAIPLKSFDETWAYLMGSHHSFIQSFSPLKRYHDWFHPEPLFNQTELRKGELWMAVKRKHAVMVLEDYAIYAKFKTDCGWMCSFDEQYFQTLLHLRDPTGIANRTVMFVDWNFVHTSSPRAFDAAHVNASLLSGIAQMTEDAIGTQHDTGMDNGTVQCTYNGIPGAKCFLFARKFLPNAVDVALEWFQGIAGARDQ